MSQSSDFTQPAKQPYQTPGSSGGSTSTSGKAIASLILGLLSFFLMCFTAIPGLILGIMGLGDVNRSQGRVGGKGLAIFGIVLSSMGLVWTIVGVLVAMLLPAVQAARTAARTVQSMNNIRQLTLSMHNYDGQFGSFPARDNNGLSWRVHLLPYLDYGNLYDQFHLDEPWDSPHNIQLLDQMPEFFDCPNANLPPGFTVYQVPYTDLAVNPEGPRALFDTSGQNVKFQDIIDGSSNTIAVIEVDEAAAVEWTKPADWEFDPSDPTRDLGNLNFGSINVSFADGSTQRIPNNIDPERLKALITKDGGEQVSRDFGY